MVEKSNVKECVLVAHSMGGNICSSFYLKHPEMVRGIIYSGTHLDGKQFRELGYSAESLIGANTPTSRVEFYTLFGLATEIALEPAKWSAHSVEGNANALIKFEMGESISQITVPTLIIHGDKDVVTPLDPCATKLQENLPNAEIIAFENANHFPIQEF